MVDIVHMTEEHATTLGWNPAGDWRFVALDGGRLVAAAGIAPLWDGRGLAWFAPGPAMRRRFWPALTRAALRGLELCPWQRVELHVRAGHGAGCRWAERLGFHHEAFCRRLLPDGADADLYVRFADAV